jgi:hypothetical protein
VLAPTKQRIRGFVREFGKLSEKEENVVLKAK